MATPTLVDDTVPIRVVWTVDPAAEKMPTLEGDDAERETGEYTPLEGDRREPVLREIRARRGQQAFRASLLEAFGFNTLATVESAMW